MENFLIIIMDVSILLFLLWWLRIYIKVQYVRNEENDNLMLEIYTLKKFIIYRLKVPVIEFIFEEFLWPEAKVETNKGEATTNVQREKRSIKETIHIFRQYQKMYNHFMNKLFLSMQCEKLIWKTVYGSNDAALTAIITGGLWGFKSIMLHNLRRRIHIRNKPLIHVKPIYCGQRFELDFLCIFSIRLGKVINATIKTLNLKEAIDGG